jgi:hypothetical protein
MAGWKGIVERSFTPDAFDRYCHTLQWVAWRPSFIVLHNTQIPSLSDRPNGLTMEHIRGLETYYRDTQGWRGGPHLFIDDKQIWVFTPLTLSGTHSPSWNKFALGVEMLGDFDRESFTQGRGLLVRRNTVSAIASLSGVLGLDPQTMKLHREDPGTTHACPGSQVKKLEIIQAVSDLLTERHAGEHVVAPTLMVPELADVSTAERARGLRLDITDSESVT